MLSNSCSSSKRRGYFTNLNYEKSIVDSVNNYQPLIIQQGDVIAVKVSGLNAQATDVINGGSDTKASELKVDNNGVILLPVIGSVKVAGLTTKQAALKIKGILEELSYVKKPEVLVAFSGFNVSVLGDVSRPGVYVMEGEKATILKAFAMAGDLNTTADEKNITLIRETNSKRDYIHLDLSQKEIFNSPYYYLKKDDVIYVKPLPQKYASVSGGSRFAGLAIPALAVVINLVALITR